jgi:uncharacterized protein YcaQ
VHRHPRSGGSFGRFDQEPISIVAAPGALSGAPYDPAVAAAPLPLSAGEARRLVLAAQGLLGAPDRAAGVAGMLRRLGAVQLDTISVLARSHELVPYARLGPVGKGAVEGAYWGGAAFEYWAHAACILPLEDWPWFEARRRRWRQGYGSRRPVPAGAMAEVLRRLAGEGPLTATDLGGARGGGPWWDWAPAKLAAERLLSRGEVVCVTRRGWKRVYDLPERAIPAPLLEMAPATEDCHRTLVRRAGRHLGVATRADLADHYRLAVREVDAVVEATGLVPVVVEGWKEQAWAEPDLLEALAGGRLRGRHRTTFLSPFDSLIWTRPRTERLFGFVHRLEAYVPAPQRVHGYFTMPLLAGGMLVGRCDPARSGRTLVAKQVSLSPRALPAMVRALSEAATWVGCDNVVVERVVPAELAPSLQAAVRAA